MLYMMPLYLFADDREPGSVGREAGQDGRYQRRVEIRQQVDAAQDLFRGVILHKTS